METENFDREDMTLPGYQAKMLQDVINNGIKDETCCAFIIKNVY